MNPILKNILACFLVLAVLAVAVSLSGALLQHALLTKSLKEQTDKLPQTLESMRQKSVAEITASLKDIEADATTRALTALAREANASRGTLKDFGKDFNKTLIEQNSELQNTVNWQLNEGRKSLVSELDGYKGVIDARLGETNGELKAFNASVASIATPAASVTQQVADAAPLFLDCEHNADCAFNRWVGTTRSVEKMSLTISKELPEFMKNTNGITHDLHAATSAYINPKWIAFRTLVASSPLLGLAFK